MIKKGGSQMKIFKLGFTLYQGNKEGRKLDFRTKLKDIEDAIFVTNSNFRKVKELKLLKVEKQELHLIFCLLEKNEDFKMSGRHLSFFSKRLYELGWKDYSSIPNRLFRTTYIKKVDDEYTKTYHEIPYIPKSHQQENIYEGIEDLELSNDDSLKVLRQLIEIQGIGDEETKNINKNHLNLIKKNLLNWVNN